MIRVDVKPEILRWARERAWLTLHDLQPKFPDLVAWERGAAKPTLKQVEALAKATSTPVGYMFLSEPPVERMPIPDYRSGRAHRADRPSPNLLEMIYLCQDRQAWYRDHARSMGEAPLPFVGSVRRSASVERVANEIRGVLGFDLEARRECPTWSDALRHFIFQADSIGVLVMCSGVVRNNNRRPLDSEEFRGFALVDELAPLVFINGKDSRAAQMFTLAHELAHVWLGQTALSDADASALPDHEVEQWCNRVAAELLLPMKALRAEYQPRAELTEEIQRLARRFKVSTLVVLRRVHDAGGVSKAKFHAAFEAELERIRALPAGTGGNFYLTQAARVSKRFARALVSSTLEGQTLYRDAFRMLGISKAGTLLELGRGLGIS